MENQEEQGYIPLNEMALLSTSQIPCAHPGAMSGSPQPLVLVHNQSIYLHLNGQSPQAATSSSEGLLRCSRPPTYQEALLEASRNGTSVPVSFLF